MREYRRPGIDEGTGLATRRRTSSGSEALGDTRRTATARDANAFRGATEDSDRRAVADRPCPCPHGDGVRCMCTKMQEQLTRMQDMNNCATFATYSVELICSLKTRRRLRQPIFSSFNGEIPERGSTNNNINNSSDSNNDELLFSTSSLSWTVLPMIVHALASVWVSSVFFCCNEGFWLLSVDGIVCNSL